MGNLKNGVDCSVKYAEEVETLERELMHIMPISFIIFIIFAEIIVSTDGNKEALKFLQGIACKHSALEPSS